MNHKNAGINNEFANANTYDSEFGQISTQIDDLLDI